MSWKITRQDFLNFFLTADTNRDGHISMKELRNVLREYGYKGSDSDINVIQWLYYSCVLRRHERYIIFTCTVKQ